LRASKEREQAQELSKKKNDLKRDFERKRQQVLERIKKLKSQNRSIEEIYKYTNDIIFEEDDEGDGLITERESKPTAQSPKVGSFSPQGIRITRDTL